MSVLSSRDIGEAVRGAIGTAATSLRPDVLSAIERAAASEPSVRGREVLSQMLENAAIAARDKVPLCQDTGTTWVWVELGLEERLGGDLAAAVDEAVHTAYDEGALRMSGGERRAVRQAQHRRQHACIPGCDAAAGHRGYRPCDAQGRRVRQRKCRAHAGAFGRGRQVYGGW